MPGRVGRSARWVGEQAAFLLVVAGVLAGLAYVLISPKRWTNGVIIIAGSTLLAALLRTVLPQTRAGMLVVRARWMDVVLFLVLGGAALAVDLRLRG